jgi:hypothetical protein
MKALVREHRWLAAQNSRAARRSRSLTSPNKRGVTMAYVCRLLPLTCLAPDIVEGILAVGSTWDVTSK